MVFELLAEPAALKIRMVTAISAKAPVRHMPSKKKNAYIKPHILGLARNTPAMVENNPIDANHANKICTCFRAR